MQHMKLHKEEKPLINVSSFFHKAGKSCHTCCRSKCQCDKQTCENQLTSHSKIEKSGSPWGVKQEVDNGTEFIICNTDNWKVKQEIDKVRESIIYKVDNWEVKKEDDNGTESIICKNENWGVKQEVDNGTESTMYKTRSCPEVGTIVPELFVKVEMDDSDIDKEDLENYDANLQTENRILPSTSNSP